MILTEIPSSDTAQEFALDEMYVSVPPLSDHHTDSCRSLFASCISSFPSCFAILTSNWSIQTWTGVTRRTERRS